MLLDDAVCFMLQSCETVHDYQHTDKLLREQTRGFKNMCLLTLLANDDILNTFGCEALRQTPSAGRLTIACNMFSASVNGLLRNGSEVFNKRHDFFSDKQILTHCLDALVSAEYDESKLKTLDVFYYKYTDVMAQLSTLISAIATNDKFLSNVATCEGIPGSSSLGYSDKELAEYVPIQSRVVPTIYRFFETNTLDDLVFITNQLLKVNTKFEMSLHHSANFNKVLNNVLKQLKDIKSTHKTLNEVLDVVKQINEGYLGCGRIMNNINLLTVRCKSLNVLTIDLWKNVLSTLDIPVRVDQ